MQIQDLLNGSHQTPTISCNVCHRVFNGQYPKRTLTRHLKSVHEAKTACYFCSKLIKIRGRSDHYIGHLKRCSTFLYTSKHMNNQEKDLLIQHSLSMTEANVSYNKNSQ